MLCFLYNYNYLLQSQSKLTNKLCVFKITMKFIDYNNLMNKRLCGQYLVDNTRFCGRYLVDIFFFGGRYLVKPHWPPCFCLQCVQLSYGPIMWSLWTHL